MTKDKSIIIKNIYYMLAYAFQVLRQKNYDEVAAEEFEDMQDLFAAVLAKGISQQLKQGLHREYVLRQENLPVLRGRPDICKTMRNHIQRKRVLSCEYDELSENNVFNQILKDTALILVKDEGVKPKQKANLKKALLFFDGVDKINPASIRWGSLKFRRNNKNYEMLMNICYFVLDGMLLTTEKGRYKIKSFSDEHMHRLYEKFVLEYFKRHHSYLSEIKAARVEWNLDEGTKESALKFLPEMRTDIFLRQDERILIIDTKYYSRAMQTQYGKETLHSGNVYQIFTYVKNQDVSGEGNVSGLLLYAKTDEEIAPDCSVVMSGNKISVKTLDLNKDFKGIRAQLDKIAEEHFKVKAPNNHSPNYT